MSKSRRKVAVITGVLAAVLAIALQFGSSGVASGRQQASRTIDAKTDPVAAGKALDICEVISKCQFVKAGEIKVAYDAPRVLGDALYNCGNAEAEDIVAISDERSESTSIDESVSAKAKLGFLGLAKASIEAEVNSKQLDEVATKLKQTNEVTVAPGTIGFTESRVPTAYLGGDAHVTNGVNLITVTNLELSYPGFGNQAINKMDWTSVHRNMTAQDTHDHCAGLPPIYPSSGVGGGRSRNAATVTVCGGPGGRCRHRRLVTGIDQPIHAGTNLVLTRGRIIYATGTAGKRMSILRARRRVTSGSYTLLLSGPQNSTMLTVTVR
jgi:hypothetical protein